MNESDVLEIRRLVSEAAAGVSEQYFMLPVADANGGEPLIQYRERVYAYELYHQLRSRWPKSPWPYSLGGEVDKLGHPIVRDGDLEAAKPDLLAHVPGTMENNLLVVEIKAARPRENPNDRAAIERDLSKLVAFRDVGYAWAILLVFGDSVERIRDYAHDSQKVRDNLHLIELYHHHRPEEPARGVAW